MFLAVDIGNTNTVLGVFACTQELALGQQSLVARWRITTSSNVTADELHAQIMSLCMLNKLDIACIRRVIVATVVPALQEIWSQVSIQLTGIDPLFVSTYCCASLGFSMQHNRQEIGPDRIANAVAARDTYGYPVIVVDFGTATNIDVVDAQGCYCGGVISPGIVLGAQALFARAARLATIALTPPTHAIGDNTADALRSGILLGAVAQCEGLVARIKKELQQTGCAMHDIKVIATGGLAHKISELTEVFDVVDQDLTLEGLKIIALDHLDSFGVESTVDALSGHITL